MKKVKEGSLILILAGSNEGDLAVVDRVDGNGRVRGHLTRGKDVGKIVLVDKGNYKVI